jgi:hypothetical protein
MSTPLHIQSNFHTTFSSKSYLPTIKLEVELGKTSKAKDWKRNVKSSHKKRIVCWSVLQKEWEKERF